MAHWGWKGIEYEADQRHAEIIVKEVGVEQGKEVVTPGVKHGQDEDQTPLVGKEAKAYRGIAARANYLSAGRHDAIFACKEVCRFMAAPIDCVEDALKRIGLHLEGRTRLMLRFTC